MISEKYAPKGKYVRWFILAVWLIVALVCFSSCATKKQIEYVDRDVNHYITNVVHDTLREKVTDSVFYSIIQRGDTIFSTKYVERTKWKERIVEKHDTCFRDSVAIEYKEVVRETTKVPNIYKFSLIFSILIIIFVLYKIGKWLKIIH